MNVIIHVTRPVDQTLIPSGSVSEKAPIPDAIIPTQPSPTSMNDDPEKGPLHQSTPNTLSSTSEIRRGRPDMGNLIATAVTAHRHPEDRIIVGACGPRELMTATRQALTDIPYNDGPAITLYTEVG